MKKNLVIFAALLALLAITMVGSSIHQKNLNKQIKKQENQQNVEVQNPAGTNNNPTNSDNGITTFTEPKGNFSFSYPSNFRLQNQDNDLTASWMNGTATTGHILAKVISPDTLQPKTNLSEAWFQVGASNNPNALTECLTKANGVSVNNSEKNSADNHMIKKSTTTIDDTQFTVFAFNDAGAGNFYDTNSYRVLRNGTCYDLEYVIHSTNIGNYSLEQNIKEFDEPKIRATLEGIVNSFAFAK